ncbi:MAG: RNA pseudouridine synthase, partial [Bacteroidales bacterium]|nr:RNA pseudouridine synthase [Bacteroidales bacterium]
APGDRVLINFEKGFKVFKNSRIKIVYEDEYIIVANKGYGLLSVSSDRIKEKTAYHILSDYLKEDNPSAKLFVIHRLDRDTSGLIMFAKSEEVQFKLQHSWNEMVLDRRYVAVISGHIDPAEGEISSYLAENSVHHVYSTSDKENGQFALTKYKTLQKNSRLSLVEVQLATGRKNQIRVHMSESGHPIAGDKRYGSKENPLGRLSLHAFRLRFVHPITRQDMLFETPIPPQFVKVTR